MNYSQVGKRIRDRRIKMNISQQQMASYLNFSYQHISNIERGMGRPSLELLVQISNILDVSMDYLLQDSLKTPEHFQGTYAITDVEDYLIKQQSSIVEIQKMLRNIS